MAGLKENQLVALMAALKVGLLGDLTVASLAVQTVLCWVESMVAH